MADLPEGAQLETDAERVERHARRLGLRPVAWDGDGLKIEDLGKGRYRVSARGRLAQTVSAAGALALLGVRGG